ncbi:hypothetical protein F4818DRAFT_130489 [Hypoxylon cercidicola]|nr:hypothetical protein F4818DRAFT_130489 [Hypoxylon cercidicola]
MDSWGPVVIAVFAFLAVGTVLILMARWSGVRAMCGRLSGSTNKRPQTNLPQSIQQALTQLEGVTEKRPVRNPQTESQEAECPICLGFLYPREARTSTSAASKKGDLDLESGLGAPKATTTTTTTTEITTQETKDQPIQPIDDEALMLKRCHHIFHARCLATWFLRKKYNCPVCRAPYYQQVEEMEPDEDYRIPPLLPVVAFW